MGDVDVIVRDLVARRHGLGLSQREVARRAGISNAALCEIERGNHSPTLGTLRAWAQALGRDVGLLMDSPSMAGLSQKAAPPPIAPTQPTDPRDLTDHPRNESAATEEDDRG